ncbi:hypothetical protein M2459_003696 [Parabacteroides sp. PF5-5]|nr:hypothetical protein [Parabacteroides sp. PH5-39]MDH6317946.1 hypothetical protein [Parabacteroides sp. PF5-13]MDH6321650.1 hypothetical protein [Parabacteroides sp. PH5-13]MDH6325401.1 hypothetical protein [Parabacteroides sp. PH5-8]MDH6329134.1 hypothetical protein [Parabacteroides sp. PH5-41]MDH6336920.1 hypothetical protein [Parabacteroides sp. PF5-5]MDH6347986.1 hypothetical protein [Parabacteroides sp. PH5-46]MDH6362959.1 hypothetical protein [Parabacteroides sp. PH5-16]MDH6378628.
MSWRQIMYLLSLQLFKTDNIVLKLGLNYILF